MDSYKYSFVDEREQKQVVCSNIHLLRHAKSCATVQYVANGTKVDARDRCKNISYPRHS